MITWALLLSGFFELWPHNSADYYYQHRSGAEARATIEVAHILHIEPWIGYGWYGRPDAKIPSSFLNLEATRSLERWYGADGYLEYRKARVGISLYRRGVDELDRVRVWGKAEIDTTHAYSIGYYDGGWPIVGYGPVTVRGPRVVRLNNGTLPWYDWHIKAEGDYRGIGYLASLSMGGPAGVYPAWDVGLRRDLFSGFGIGVSGGRIESPGWGTPIYRIAAVATAKVSTR